LPVLIVLIQWVLFVCIDLLGLLVLIESNKSCLFVLIWLYWFNESCLFWLFWLIQWVLFVLIQ
jgi:hypothetical protein